MGNFTKEELSRILTTTHGGHRPKSGRKKKPPTKTLSFRVPKDAPSELKSLISAYIKSLF